MDQIESSLYVDDVAASARFTRRSLGFLLSAISESAAGNASWQPPSFVALQEAWFARNSIAARSRRRASYCVRGFGFGIAQLGSMARRERDHRGREAHVGLRWTERPLPRSGPASPGDRHPWCLVRVLTPFHLRLSEG